MGRKPTASAKLVRRTAVLKPQSMNSVGPTLDSDIRNPSSEKVDLQLEKPNPAAERVESQANSSKLSSKKAKKVVPVKVRRSSRLQSVVAQKQHVNNIIQEITIGESEDEPEDGNLTESGINENWKEKTGHPVDLLEPQQKTTDKVKSKETKNISNESPSSSGDISYKNLYIDSRKKLEALMEENLQLSRKLERSLGKNEVYETGLLSESLGQLKDVISNLTNATEAMMKTSSEAICAVYTALGSGHAGNGKAKRKRRT